MANLKFYNSAGLVSDIDIPDKSSLNKELAEIKNTIGTGRIFRPTFTSSIRDIAALLCSEPRIENGTIVADFLVCRLKKDLVAKGGNKLSLKSSGDYVFIDLGSSIPNSDPRSLEEYDASLDNTLDVLTSIADEAGWTDDVISAAIMMIESYSAAVLASRVSVSLYRERIDNLLDRIVDSGGNLDTVVLPVIPSGPPTEEKKIVPKTEDQKYAFIPNYSVKLTPSRIKHEKDFEEEHIPTFYKAKVLEADKSIHLFRFKKLKSSFVGKHAKIVNVIRKFKCSKDGHLHDCALLENAEGKRTKFVLEELELKALDIRAYAAPKNRTVEAGTFVKCRSLAAIKANRKLRAELVYKVIKINNSSSLATIEDECKNRYTINKQYLKRIEIENGINTEKETVKVSSKSTESSSVAPNPERPTRITAV